jgi:hypothetical protein
MPAEQREHQCGDVVLRERPCRELALCVSQRSIEHGAIACSIEERPRQDDGERYPRLRLVALWLERVTAPHVRFAGRVIGRKDDDRSIVQVQLLEPREEPGD